jgi:hypothetical protein
MAALAILTNYFIGFASADFSLESLLNLHIGASCHPGQ